MNAYDDCVAWIDEQLGRLVDELGHRGLLASTWVIIASDHGESFGEHRGVYCHGASLYQTELHVPLLILPPASRPLQSSVNETVSLRDLAATIVDLSGDRSKSHFPGTSLTRFWDASPGATQTGGDHAIAEVVPNEFLDPDPAKSSEPGWPLGALKQNGWAFIRRERDGREELYHLRRDSNEQNNLAADPSQQAQLDSMLRRVETNHGGATHAATDLALKKGTRLFFSHRSVFGDKFQRPTTIVRHNTR